MPYLVLHSPPLASFPCHLPSSRFPIQTQKPAAWIHPRNHRAALLRGIRCMAKPRRVAMVAKQIQRELSDMLLTDKVLQYAILPEVSLGADRYLSSLTTISDVEVSTDLQREGGCTCWAKVKSKSIRGELGRRMKLRLTPEIRFIEDESLERGSRSDCNIRSDKNEKKVGEVQDEEELESSNAPQDDKDWEDDDPDEDIIYIK
ncbi:hypothetical protein J5N97_000121 [Dioscorea zingiberensis]|uniref:Ribosome-binding factor A, chloroplastic n=1 Tax=Dioscorea zingiberensis TaxID=325984 RepID=A0A9D5BSP8_9LILI|nr:hypothetical protein J5N97_000121 [Dioscorea zingiberensis]